MPPNVCVIFFIAFLVSRIMHGEIVGGRRRKEEWRMVIEQENLTGLHNCVITDQSGSRALKSQNIEYFIKKLRFIVIYQSKCKNSSFHDLYCCLTTKTFQLKIILVCFRFVKVYTLKILSLKISWELSKKSNKKLLICPPQKFCSKNFSDLFI